MKSGTVLHLQFARFKSYEKHNIVKLGGQQGFFFLRTAAVVSGEFVKAAQTAPVALNVSGLADSGVLGKLLIDDSVTERKLSPMHNS